MLARGRYEMAEELYKKARSAGKEGSSVHFGLGKALKRQGRYEEAFRSFEKARKKENAHPLAKQEKKACQAALEWIEDPVCEVEPVTALNSPYRDYGPSFADTLYSSLVFASVRPTQCRNAGVFYSSRANYGNWSRPELYRDKLETPAEDGPAMIAHERDELYLTRCDGSAGCDMVLFEEEGKSWTKEAVLDLLQPCAPDTVNVAHPTYFHEERKLFFASDLPGGQGGFDIWYITYDPETEKWSDPVNAGEGVNSTGDELFPYIRENGTLYFSSDGHLTMGGMDIFRAKRKDRFEWGPARNMGYPINSPADDHGIIFEGNGMKGFFSTDRDGENTKGKDDIFRFFLKT